MALRPCACPCGQTVSVQQAFIGHVVGCPRCGQQFRAVVVREEPDRALYVRTLTFVCAADNKPFEVLFGWDYDRQIFKIGKVEHGTGASDRLCLGNDAREGRIIVEQESAAGLFNASDFDFSDFRCLRCGSAGSFNYHMPPCGTKFCQHRTGRDGYAICPGCSQIGYYTGPILTLDGEQAIVRRPQRRIAAAAAPVRRVIAAPVQHRASRPELAPHGALRRIASGMQRLLQGGRS